jgi:penicillin amidase
MNSSEPTPTEPILLPRRTPGGEGRVGASAHHSLLTPLQSLRRRIFFRTVVILTAFLVLIATAGFFYGRHWVHRAMRDNLPQLDGTLSIAGLSAPVTVQRDDEGVPHIRAASLDDLVIAQGYVTAQDRLWQMETLRRHAAGELAEILGPSLIAHDRAQRFLQIRAAADRAIAVLPADQLHSLELYAQGVNASIADQRAHLPLEFRILRFEPAPWTPRDTLLVYLAMFQDLTNSFPEELSREALTAKLPAPLVADLYPVGSWRDHPPAQPMVDLTAPQTNIPNVPLDESQSQLSSPEHLSDLLAARRILAPILSCEGCTAGSNDWVVSGAHTASGKPLLSNDMHLNHGVPGTWYQADLEAPTPTGEFHVAGVSLPGAPFIVVGHNEHLAWGFTNLGATVQDVSIERTRGTGATAEYQTTDGTWQPLLHQKEIIHVKGGKDVVLDVIETRHGNILRPIVSGIFPAEKRALSLNWTIYDPSNITDPFLAINAANDWPSLHAAFSTFGGPSQNLVYADDQGNIGYHAVGKIPIRGSLAKPTPISPVPTDALDTTQEWAGYIPFDQLPQTFDPSNGILATANARVTPDNYPYPITLDWAAPYRNERIWKVLSSGKNLTPADMLALQTDVYSDVDHVIAQRLAYAIDHTVTPAFRNDKRLHQAADLLREWNGNVDADAAAPAIVDAARTALWPLLLNPQLGPRPGDAAQLYTWGEKAYAEEWLIMHTPARWLSSKYATWDDLLAAAVAKGLLDAHSPFDLKKWHYGQANPVDIEHPIFGQSPILQRLVGLPIGTGVQPQSGDHTTVKQVGRVFGPSERFTADLSNLDRSTLNLVLGQSGNPASPWFMSQWRAWYHGTTLAMPFSNPAVDVATRHTLTLTPK